MIIRFTLEVVSGPRKGESVNLDPMTPLTLGADPKAGWVVPGQGAKPLHARLAMEHGTFWLENLSSSGTVVDGLAVMERTPLAIGSVIAFGETSLRLTSNTEEQKRSLVLPLLIVVILLGGTLAFIVVPALNAKTGILARSITDDDWHKVYAVLDARLQRWDRDGHLPLNFLEYFHHAWFSDRSGDTKKALLLWRELYIELATQPFPGLTPPGKSVAAINPDTEDYLYVVMRHDVARYAEQAYFTGGDNIYLRALWWFVGLRIKELSKEDAND